MQTLVQNLLLASLGIVLLYLGVRLLRAATGSDVVWRYRVQVAALLVALALLPVQVLLIETSRGSPETRTASTNFAPADADLPAPGLLFRTNLPGEQPATGDRPAHGSSNRVWSMLFLLYASGVGAGAVLLLVRIFRTIRLARSCTPCTHPVPWPAGETRKRRRPAPRLFQSDQLVFPACVGSFFPIVVLPARSAAHFSQQDLQLAMAHEWIHLRRRDGLIQLGQHVALVFFWFHPLVWSLCRLISVDRELSCDALVVRATGRPKTYAKALLSCCQQRMTAGRSTLRAAAVVTGFDSLNSVQRRIHMLGSALRPLRGRRVLLAQLIGLSTVSVLAAGQAALASIWTPTELFVRHGTMQDAGVKLVPGDEVDGKKTVEVRSLPGDRTTAGLVKRMRAYAEYRGEEFDFDGWVTDMESLVSAENAQVEGSRLTASQITMNLPEGSNMRAVVAGKSMEVTSNNDESVIRLTEGSMQLLDVDGVPRATGRVAQDEPGSVLVLRATIEADEVSFQLAGQDRAGARIPVMVQVDTQTGVPAGEEQPPHGSVRYQLQTDEDERLVRVKIQWIYDLSRAEADRIR